MSSKNRQRRPLYREQLPAVAFDILTSNERRKVFAIVTERHSCTHCGYYAASTRDLREHYTKRVKHIGSEKVKCYICDKHFCMRQTMEGHHKVEHSSDGLFGRLRRAEANAARQVQAHTAATISSFGSAGLQLHPSTDVGQGVGGVGQEFGQQAEERAEQPLIDGEDDESNYEQDWAAEAEALLRQSISTEESGQTANDDSAFDAVDDAIQTWFSAFPNDQAGNSPELTDGITEAEWSDASTPHPMNDTSSDSFGQKICVCDDHELPDHNWGVRVSYSRVMLSGRRRVWRHQCKSSKD